jgi:hypothetical protein
MFMVRRTAAVIVLLAAPYLIACAEPPNPEMDRAQGAIDAARAAGAEQYATTEYAAATAALQSAHEAVAARDYRLALSYALESHEHAQNAARETADVKARMRGDVERAIAEIRTLVREAQDRLVAAQKTGVPRRLTAPPGEALTAASASLQKAGEALVAGDYFAANAALEGVREAVDEAIAAVDTASRSQTLRRRR